MTWHFANGLDPHPEELGTEYENDHPRPYAAQIDLSQVPAHEHWPVNRGGSDEHWVNRPDLAQVRRVVPLQQALNEQDVYDHSYDQNALATQAPVISAMSYKDYRKFGWIKEADVKLGIQTNELDDMLNGWFNPKELRPRYIDDRGWHLPYGPQYRLAPPSGEQREAPAEWAIDDHGAHPDSGQRQAWPKYDAYREPIEHVYRAMHPEEWAEAQRKGYIQSNGQGNIADWEGTNAGIDPRTAWSYLPRGQYGTQGHIIKLQVHPDDGWFSTSHDDYVRTRNPIPLDRVQAVSPLIDTENEGASLGQPLMSWPQHPPVTSAISEHWSFVKKADKLHDFLMNPKSRPDLQTPEAQEFLGSLEKNYHNQKTDALTPWLTREWKKGRVKMTQPLPSEEAMHAQADAGAQAAIEAMGPNSTFNPEEMRQRLYESIVRREMERNPAHLKVPDADGPWGQYVNPEAVDHWGDFMRSNHPIQRGLGDIMQHDVHSFKGHVDQWDQAMKDKQHAEALAGGQVVHTTPDGYTVRRLHTPEELKAEGDTMGHCVGGYSQQVANGSSMIYSLRDPEGRPHATTEIEPTRWNPESDQSTDFRRMLDANHDHPILGQDHVRQGLQNYHNFMEDYSGGKIPSEHLDWQGLYNQSLKEFQDTHRPGGLVEGGNVVQIQGKGNDQPNPEYKKQLAHWFGSFSDEDRPQREQEQWNMHGDPDTLDDVDNVYPHHLQPPETVDDYGLNVPPPEIDWPDMVDSTINHRGGYGRGRDYDPSDGDTLHQVAKAHGQIPEFASAVQDFGERQQDSFDEFRDMNHEYVGPYPDEDDYEDPNDYNDAMKDYEQNEQGLVDEHPGMQATNHMYQLLTPHYNQTTQQYQNQPVQPAQGTFS